MQNFLNTEKLIRLALEEDISHGDITTESILRERVSGRADLIAKGDGIICGLKVFERTFKILDKDVACTFFKRDGDEVKRGEKIAVVTGDMRAILSGERTALNFLQRMSGIATYTAETLKLLEGSKVKLLDTRKTTPNMRPFEKYAVRTGGGKNHRYNLSDGVLLKDNHISAAGGVKEAIALAKDYAPATLKIEVEVENLEMCKEAVAAGADIIMLDNMTAPQMKEAVDFIAGRAKTECSGNITKENISEVISCGVDFISSGALTHSAPILDLSLKNLKPEN